MGQVDALIITALKEEYEDGARGLISKKSPRYSVA
jgi:hypothetical protein